MTCLSAPPEANLGTKGQDSGYERHLQHSPRWFGLMLFWWLDIACSRCIFRVYFTHWFAWRVWFHHSKAFSQRFITMAWFGLVGHLQVSEPHKWRVFFVYLCDTFYFNNCQAEKAEFVLNLTGPIPQCHPTRPLSNCQNLPPLSLHLPLIGLTIPHICLVLLQDTCAVCFAHLYIYDVSPKVACMHLGKKTSVLSSFCSGYPGINSTDWVNCISDSPCALMSCCGFLQLWGA